MKLRSCLEEIKERAGVKQPEPIRFNVKALAFKKVGL